ncbi:Uncharacterised protein [Vibrio cholerae]|nr:Uncharacterised protein [Vibrio cholerae]
MTLRIDNHHMRVKYRIANLTGDRQCHLATIRGDLKQCDRACNHLIAQILRFLGQRHLSRAR